MATKLAELVECEAANLEATTKHLGASSVLIGDVETLYEKLTPLLKFPGGDLDTSDELMAVVSIIHEFSMCRMLFMKAALAALRMYQGDAFTHLRRAIETCAFAVRMSKHHDLSRVWAEGGTDKDGDGRKYKAYRQAFRTEDAFPNKKHPDYDPRLTNLKGRFELCSKTIHGSIFGMANHFGNVSPDKNTAQTRRVNLFDMRPDSFMSNFFYILDTHRVILQLFGQALEPYTNEFDSWKKEYLYVEGKLQRHGQKWAPNIKALSVARNQKLSKAQASGS